MKTWGRSSLIFILSFSSLLPLAKAFEIHARKESVIVQLLDWRSEISASTEISAREKDLRLQLCNRLLFQVERKYQETDLHQFMIDRTGDMKDTDEMRDNQSYGGINAYLENLKEALKTLIEPRENVVSFIRDFTRFCNVSTVCSVDKYAETRNYSDGKEMEKADPMDVDEAAESVALKIAADDKAAQESDEASQENKSSETNLKHEDYLNLGKNLKQESDFQFVIPVQEELTEQSPETSH